jgi:hypothetical protein
MATNDALLWIYLGRRDKSGIKILSQFRGKKIMATRIGDINNLQLPVDYTDVISKAIYENRFLYEPWIESALTFIDLRNQLESRGYYNIPVSNVPLYGTSSINSAPEISMKNLQQTKTMIRKIS